MHGLYIGARRYGISLLLFNLNLCIYSAICLLVFVYRVLSAQLCLTCLNNPAWCTVSSDVTCMRGPSILCFPVHVALLDPIQDFLGTINFRIDERGDRVMTQFSRQCKDLTIKKIDLNLLHLFPLLCRLGCNPEDRNIGP